MHYVLVVLMAILGAMFPGFLVKAIKSTDKNEADGALFGARVILGMLNQSDMAVKHRIFWNGLG